MGLPVLHGFGVGFATVWGRILQGLADVLHGVGESSARFGAEFCTVWGRILHGLAEVLHGAGESSARFGRPNYISLSF